jgi:hypothetical protein
VIVADAGGCVVVVDPAQNILYRPSRSQGLYHSKDDGQTWERLGSGYREPWLLAIDPQDSRKLWITEGCSMRPLLSTDGGLTFAEVESFPNEICGNPILLAHPDGRRVYVEDNGFIHRSDDGGEMWRHMVELGGMYRAATLDPSDPDVLYLGSTHKGVVKTTSGGYAWFQANDGLTNFSINEIVIDPGNPQIVYVATDGGVFVSVDGGGMWWPIQGGLGPNPIVYSIAVDLSDPSKVYAATPDGVYRLVGTPLTIGVPTTTSIPTYTPTPSPADEARVFAGPILSAIADRAPDYEDRFDDPNSGWPIGSSDGGDECEWGYQDGAYSILQTTYFPLGGGHCFGIGSVSPPRVSDFVLEIDARFVSGEWGYWQVLFREVPGTLEDPNLVNYGLAFFPDGVFNLFKGVGELHIELTKQPVYAPAFEQGFGTNRLTLIVQGPQIAIYVNGEPVWFVYDEPSGKGTISLGAQTRTDVPLLVYFDNLKIWDISGLTAPAAAPTTECRIVYGQDGDIYVRDCDGSGESRLTDHSTSDWLPAWSPDGTRIVFASDRDAVQEGWGQLYIVDADGSNLTRMTHTERNDEHPSWSPDGKRIAFHSGCALVVINAQDVLQGTDSLGWTTLLEAGDDLCVGYPTWSPDGQRIAFRSLTRADDVGPYQHDVYVVDDDGSGLTKLASFTSEERGLYVVWSPDGSQIAFDVVLDGQQEYYAVNSDGSEEPAGIFSIPDAWYPWYDPQWGGKE